VVVVVDEQSWNRMLDAAVAVVATVYCDVVATSSMIHVVLVHDPNQIWMIP
jgi:hypothetical protein